MMPSKLEGELGFKPLEIIIIGGGIGGLTASIALRQQDHNVTIFEQSKYSSETGAAIQMAPNATSVLRKLGINLAESGANMLEKMRTFDSDGNLIKTIEIGKEAHRWQSDWRLVHRAHLHAHLRRVATSSEGDGRPVTLCLSSRILSVDPISATVTLEDGNTVTADLIIGADGVHSITRRVISDRIEARKGHHNAFRFLVPRAAALDDPITAGIASEIGTTALWYSEDRKVIVYPCSNNELLNVVGVHPAYLSTATDDYSSTSGNKEQMLDIYKDFNPAVVGLLKMASNLKLYPLFDMDQLPTFASGRLALIGDAAHPFLPHLAQGGAMAIEDAVALGVLIERGLLADEVPVRLELYNKARYVRASHIQDLTRLVGGDAVSKDNTQQSNLAFHDYLDYALSHDEIHASTQILRDYKWKQQVEVLHQPIAFGPSQRYYSGGPHRYISKTSTVLFRTSATVLRGLFPTSEYRFASRDTVAYASFRLHEMDVNGRNFYALGFYIYGVEYMQSDCRIITDTDQTIAGSHLVVMFKNDVDSVQADREELGYPTLYSDIKVDEQDDHVIVTMAWRGIVWCQMKILDISHTNGHVVKEPPIESEKIIVCTLLPGHNEPAKPGINFEAMQNVIQVEKHSSRASLEFDQWDQKRLPTLHHIVSYLAELPIIEFVGGRTVEFEQKI